VAQEAYERLSLRIVIDCSDLLYQPNATPIWA